MRRRRFVQLGAGGKLRWRDQRSGREEVGLLPAVLRGFYLKRGEKPR